MHRKETPVKSNSECPHCGHGSDRPLDTMSMKGAQNKFKDIKMHGHPDNFFNPIFSMSSASRNMRRSLDAKQVEGGGVIIQTCWYENGQICSWGSYEPDLAMVERSYMDDDGKKRVDWVLVHKSVAESEKKAISMATKPIRPEFSHRAAHDGHTAPRQADDNFDMKCMSVNEMNIYQGRR